MSITSKIKNYSRIGSRATFGLVALELANEFENLMILTSDVSTSAGLDRYRNSFSNKYLEVGIAEQNLIGIASGMASEGFITYTTTFSPFQTLRCCEQIKINLGYMKHKVCLVGLASGVVLGNLGYSHCSIEDISIMRSIPNITVVSPADCFETSKAIKSFVTHDSPMYIRLTGGSNNQPVYNKDYKFKIGKNVVLKKGDDITIFATGTMVYESLITSLMLEKKGISAAVINVHTIKPLDKKNIFRYSKGKKLVVTVEEHSTIGGLGSAIAEQLITKDNMPRQVFLGLQDNYNMTGSYNYVKEKNGLTAKLISKKITQAYDKIK